MRAVLYGAWSCPGPRRATDGPRISPAGRPTGNAAFELQRHAVVGSGSTRRSNVGPGRKTLSHGAPPFRPQLRTAFCRSTWQGSYAVSGAPGLLTRSMHAPPGDFLRDVPGRTSVLGTAQARFSGPSAGEPNVQATTSHVFHALKSDRGLRARRDRRFLRIFRAWACAARPLGLGVEIGCDRFFSRPEKVTGCGREESS